MKLFSLPAMLVVAITFLFCWPAAEAAARRGGESVEVAEEVREVPQLVATLAAAVSAVVLVE